MPLIAERQFARTQLRYQNRPCFRESFHDGRRFVDELFVERFGSPRGGVAAGSNDVFRAPWDSVKQPTISAVRHLTIKLAGLFQSPLGGQSYDAIQFGVVTPEPGQVHLRQLDGADLSRSNQLRQLCDRPKSHGFQVGGPLDRIGLAGAKDLPDLGQCRSRHSWIELYGRWSL